MIDLTTYIVYLSLLIIVTTLTSVSPSTIAEANFNYNKVGFKEVLAVLLISFIVGWRYEVGVDWESYKNQFEYINSHLNLHFNQQYFEFGFYLLIRVVGKLNFGYEWFFFISAAIAWFTIIKGIPKFLLPAAMFFIFADEYFFWSMNGVRQFISIGFWLFSIKYIISKDLLPFAITIVIGSLFHSSILLMTPFYFISKIPLPNIWSLLTIFFISLLIGGSPQFSHWANSILDSISGNLELTGKYLSYSGSEKLMTTNITLGLGFWFRILINFCLIIFSGYFVTKFPESKTYLLLFIFGAILFNLTYNIHLIGRISHYFLIIRSVLLSLLLITLWKKNKSRPLAVSIVLLYFILFLNAIANSSNMCSPYNSTIF